MEAIPAMEAVESSDYNYESSLDQLIAPGLRLWMLIAMIIGILLVMVMIVCCFMKIRIPRTKREIEMMTAKRERRKGKRAANHRPSVFVDPDSDVMGCEKGGSTGMELLRPPILLTTDGDSFTSEDDTQPPTNSSL